MRIKADWPSYLHKIRTREFVAVFDRCPKRAFPKVLELGAGDGFLSTLLADYADELISTDLNPHRLTKSDYRNVTYRICDAEEVSENFGAGEFDMVFSCNLLEHLPDCDRALRGVRRVLKDDGITIHYMPNRCWKLATVLLHVPNKVTKFIDKVLSGRIFRRAKDRKHRRRKYTGNNPRTPPRRRFFPVKLFLPRIHGVSNNTISEFVAFGRNRWVRQFEDAGFEILCVKKVGFSSGYGFGCDRIRKLMEKMGIHTCYVYIAHKAGCRSRYDEYFR